jgi:hypothetical protein
MNLGHTQSRDSVGGPGSVRRLAIADVLNDEPLFPQSSALPHALYDDSRWPYRRLPPLPPPNPGFIASETLQQRGLRYWAHSNQLYHPPAYVPPRALAPPQTNVMNSFLPESYMTHADRPQPFFDQRTCFTSSFILLPKYHKGHAFSCMASTSSGSSPRKGSKFTRAHTNVWSFFRYHTAIFKARAAASTITPESSTRSSK